jgi:hypothetical protein
MASYGTPTWVNVVLLGGVIAWEAVATGNFMARLLLSALRLLAGQAGTIG